MATAADPRIAGRVAFTYPDFIRYELARFFIVLALEMQSVAVGWQVYDITKRPLDLGLIGLAQFLPGIVLFLPAGHAADRFDRRNLLTICYLGFALASGLLLATAWLQGRSVHAIYAIVVFLGIVRTFNWPVSRALLPQLIAAEHFPNAVAWNSSIFQGATILGPAAGGVIYAFFRGPAAVYASALLAACAAMVSTLQIHPKRRPPPREPVEWDTVLAGFQYVWRQKVVLGSISLDMFAVFLGGAVALLPVYAREILRTGPWGLGLLRAAPGAGAAIMAVLLAYRPLRRHVGEVMLLCVAGFGLFTSVFGVSRSLPISLLALLLVGASDMVSVVVRGTLVQVATPDAVRGRVNAVDMIFIGASNELGEFESGLTAHWFGTVPAVILGGAGTLIVVGLWAWMFPELRKVDRLSADHLVPVGEQKT